MSIKKTQIGLTKHLSSFVPVLPTAYENVSFIAPAGMYQRVQFKISKPDDPTFGKGYHRERVELQIFIYGQANTGTGEILDRAELLKTHFAKGTTIVESGFYIHIVETPTIAGTTIIGDRVICPLLISTITEVIT